MKLPTYTFTQNLYGGITVNSNYTPFNKDFKNIDTFIKFKRDSDNIRACTMLSFLVERLLSLWRMGDIPGHEEKALKECKTIAESFYSLTEYDKQERLLYCINYMMRFTKSINHSRAYSPKEIKERLEFLMDYYELYLKNYEPLTNDFLAR